MSDEETRELVRAAEASWEPEAWLRAGRAFVRAARWDEAGHAFARARAVGAATDEDLDALAPPLDRFEVLSVHRLDLPDHHLDEAAWSRDARKVFVTGTNLTELDVASGATRLVAATVQGALGVGEEHVLHGVRFESYWQPVRRTIASGAVVLLREREARLTRAVVSGRADEILTYATPDLLTTYLVAPEAVRLVNRPPGTFPAFSVGEGGRCVLLQHKSDGITLIFRDYSVARADSIVVPARQLGVEIVALATRLIAVGRRALVQSRHASTLLLASAEGRVLGRLGWPPADDPDTWASTRAASPSGRFVAGTYSHGVRRASVADVLTGERRSFDLASVMRGPSVEAAAWAPSGRRLALVTPRELVILGA